MANLLTIAEWAQREQMTPARVYKLIDEGRIPYINKPGRVGITRMIDADTQKPPAKVAGRPKKQK